MEGNKSKRMKEITNRALSGVALGLATLALTAYLGADTLAATQQPPQPTKTVLVDPTCIQDGRVEVLWSNGYKTGMSTDGLIPTDSVFGEAVSIDANTEDGVDPKDGNIQLDNNCKAVRLEWSNGMETSMSLADSQVPLSSGLGDIETIAKDN